MTRHNADAWSPSPEQLAAYADGELDRCPQGAFLKGRIEEWLAAHPDGATEVEALRRLARLWQAGAAPAPAEPAWEPVRASLRQAALEPADLPSRGAGRWLGWGTAVLVASAALVLLTLSLVPRPENTLPPEPEGLEPLPVATADEVEIIRVDGDATDGVVIGELPVPGPIVLARPGEVTILKPEPGEVRLADLRMDPDPPMVWATPEEVK
jgi:hypothetical protein